MSRSNISLALDLGKVRIAIPVMLSGLTGYLAGAESIHAAGWWVMLGVLLLSMGASALNQIQERKFDARMPRTMRRPLPSGQLKLAQAWMVTLVLILAGSLVLLYGAGMTSMLLGLMTILWYNGIYTYLKRITAFAVVPGSVVGALPPLIGWAATGLPLWTESSVSLAFFFFIGQIPHFWLIILMIGPQYEQAGYPSLSAIFSQRQISNLTLIWAVSSGITALILPLFGVIRLPYLQWLLLLPVAWIIYVFMRTVKTGLSEATARRGFLYINLFFLFVMMLVIADALIR
ncbi:MAG TPA: protoheme IX farnesyltransferase [Bacteroidales bacterium]|nr:protoheme IX farnesyltransferase [Bacteroidales bacterium]